jgi:hypothetical protein
MASVETANIVEIFIIARESVKRNGLTFDVLGVERSEAMQGFTEA